MGRYEALEKECGSDASLFDIQKPESEIVQLEKSEAESDYEHDWELASEHSSSSGQEPETPELAEKINLLSDVNYFVRLASILLAIDTGRVDSLRQSWFGM